MNFLPLGSIIEIKYDEEKNMLLMIVARGVTTPEGIKSYACVRYPYGFDAEIGFFTFDSEKIENIVHYGFHSDIDDIYLEELNSRIDLEKKQNF